MITDNHCPHCAAKEPMVYVEKTVELRVTRGDSSPEVETVPASELVAYDESCARYTILSVYCEECGTMFHPASLKT